MNHRDPQDSAHMNRNSTWQCHHCEAHNDGQAVKCWRCLTPPKREAIAREVGRAIGCPDWSDKDGCDARGECYCETAARAVLVRFNVDSLQRL